MSERVWLCDACGGIGHAEPEHKEWCPVDQAVPYVPEQEIQRLREALERLARGKVPSTGDWGDCMMNAARAALDTTTEGEDAR